MTQHLSKRQRLVKKSRNQIGTLNHFITHVDSDLSFIRVPRTVYHALQTSSISSSDNDYMLLTNWCFIINNPYNFISQMWLKCHYRLFFFFFHQQLYLLIKCNPPWSQLLLSSDAFWSRSGRSLATCLHLHLSTLQSSPPHLRQA